MSNQANIEQNIPAFNSLIATTGESFDLCDWSAGTLEVEQHGLSKPIFLFKQNDRILAQLYWLGPKRSHYITANKRIYLDLFVANMGLKVIAKDQLSRIAKLQLKQTLNLHKAKMVISLGPERFFIRQKANKGKPMHSWLHVIKEHYITELLSIQFTPNKCNRRAPASSSKIIATIHINPLMRWEAKHFHHIIALLTTRIIFINQLNNSCTNNLLTRKLSPVIRTKHISSQY